MSLNKEPDNTFEAQQLVLALQEYLEASHEERRACDEYMANDGHSWDYAGEYKIAARDHAAATFADKLNHYVDSRVKLLLTPQLKPKSLK